MHTITSCLPFGSSELASQPPRAQEEVVIGAHLSEVPLDGVCSWIARHVEGVRRPQDGVDRERRGAGSSQWEAGGVRLKLLVTEPFLESHGVLTYRIRVWVVCRCPRGRSLYSRRELRPGVRLRWERMADNSARTVFVVNVLPDISHEEAVREAKLVNAHTMLDEV